MVAKWTRECQRSLLQHEKPSAIKCLLWELEVRPEDSQDSGWEDKDLLHCTDPHVPVHPGIDTSRMVNPYKDNTTFKMMVTLCIEVFFNFLAPSGDIDIRIKFSICSKVTKKVHLYESLFSVKLLKSRTVFQGHINNEYWGTNGRVWVFFTKLQFRI